ncbi:MAG: hypothetical protein Q4E16_05575 [Neisseria sp.]|nr:hypothetical protein [Neisseria sp.]
MKFNSLWLVSALLLAFVAGMKVQAWLYDDMCLDLGGGREPHGSPICVISKK